MKKLRLIHLLALLAAALYVTAPAYGVQPVTTSLQVPLAGTVLVPLSDGSFDTVALTGQVPPNSNFPVDSMRISVNLDQVFGRRRCHDAAARRNGREPGQRVSL